MYHCLLRTGAHGLGLHRAVCLLLCTLLVCEAWILPIHPVYLAGAAPNAGQFFLSQSSSLLRRQPIVRTTCAHLSCTDLGCRAHKLTGAHRACFTPSSAAFSRNLAAPCLEQPPQMLLRGSCAWAENLARVFFSLTDTLASLPVLFTFCLA